MIKKFLIAGGLAANAVYATSENYSNSFVALMTWVGTAVLANEIEKKVNPESRYNIAAFMTMGGIISFFALARLGVEATGVESLLYTPPLLSTIGGAIGAVRSIRKSIKEIK